MLIQHQSIYATIIAFILTLSCCIFSAAFQCHTLPSRLKWSSRFKQSIPRSPCLTGNMPRCVKWLTFTKYRNCKFVTESHFFHTFSPFYLYYSLCILFTSNRIHHIFVLFLCPRKSTIRHTSLDDWTISTSLNPDTLTE